MRERLFFAVNLLLLSSRAAPEAISQSEIVEGYPNVRLNRKAGVVSLAK